MASRTTRLLLSFAAIAASTGCLGTTEDELGVESAPLAARCEVRVEGTGVVNVETNYIPRVVRCEHGSADFEGLKALAVAARSVLYYTLERRSSIGDGTAVQVYSCGDREVLDRHRRAAEETSGLVLRYRRTQVYGFHVAGARQSPPTCRGSTDDPYDTERYVTYNRGRSGDGIRQTPLGWVDPGNHANRGCLSQNGSSCLSTTGMGFREILRYYYGDDIEIVRAEGSCVVTPEPPEPPPPPPPEDAGSPPTLGGDAGPAEPTDAGPIEVVPDASEGAPDAMWPPMPPPPTSGRSDMDRAIHGGCTASGLPRSSSSFAWIAVGILVLAVRARRD